MTKGNPTARFMRIKTGGFEHEYSMRAANSITFAQFKGDKARKVASRNAYRRAIGLPEIKSS